MAERETGTVMWFSVTKGYGFIARDQGGDIFVHNSSIRGQARRGLKEGQHVEFTVGQGEKGPLAQEVVVIP